MLTTVTPDEAEAQIRDLIARVEHGEVVVIERDGQPIVRLMPAPGPVPGRRKLGWARELYGPLPEGWDDPLTEEELALFEGPLTSEDPGGEVN